jgi:flagellar motor switch protein FliN/FliY
MTSNTTSLEWVKTVDDALRDLDQNPQFGPHASFDWQSVEQELSQLVRQKVQLSHEERGWIPAQQSLEGFSGNPRIFSLAATPLQPPAYWVMNDEDLRRLILLLFGNAETAAPFIEDPYLEGFSNYLILEALHFVSRWTAKDGVSLQLASNSVKPEQLQQAEHFFIIEIQAEFSEFVLSGRLLLSSSFRDAWKRHVLLKGNILDEEWKKKTTLDIALEVGNTPLTLKEWSSVKEGDFVLLESCSYDPEEKKGRILLTLNKRPLFRGKIGKEGIKLFNYPLYEQEGESMAKRFFDEDDDEDEDLYGGLKNNDDEDFSDFESEDEDEEEIPEEETVEPLEDEEESLSLKSVSHAEAVTPDKIPIQLTVEVGRVRMTAHDLLNLSPGNLLELNVRPEQGVDLIVNGKKVGRGELVKVGEILGVRILQL